MGTAALTTPQSLDYYLQSDAWKRAKERFGTTLDWEAVDAYVDKGLMTPRERDLLHAYYSAWVLHTPSTGWDIDPSMPKFPEWQAAHKKYADLKAKYKLTPVAFGDPSRGDYYGRVPAGPWGNQAAPPPVGDAPRLPPPGTPGAGDLAVNTKALALFRNNVVLLKDMIDYSMTFVNQVNVKPGAFNKAYAIRDRVNGRGEIEGLKWDTYKFMQNAAAALVDIYNEIGKLIIDYDSAEELNNLSGERLRTIMAESFTDIDASKNYGNNRTANGNSGTGGNGNGNGNNGSGTVQNT